MRFAAGLLFLVVGGGGIALAAMLAFIQVVWIALMMLIGFSWQEVTKPDQGTSELLSHCRTFLTAGVPFFVVGILLIRKKNGKVARND